MASGLIKQQEMTELPPVNAVQPAMTATTGMSTGRVTGAGNVAYSGNETVWKRANPAGVPASTPAPVKKTRNRTGGGDNRDSRVGGSGFSSSGANQTGGTHW